MQLLPWQVHLLIARQAVQRPRFDGMHNLLWSACGRNEIEPASRRKFGVIEPQNIFRDRVAASKTVEEPTVEFVLLQGFLYRFDVGVIHDEKLYGLECLGDE